MSKITPFLSNTESLLHYPEKRLNWVLLVTTLFHLAVLLTVNIHPIIKKWPFPFPNKQLAVTLSPQSDTPPQVADYFGLHHSKGQLQETLPSESALTDSTVPSFESSAQHVISTMTRSHQTPIPKVVTPIRSNNPSKLLEKKVISSATFSHEDAEYLYRWQQYVEAVASEFYPKDAIQQNITGKLLLLVVLNPDGSLHEATIRQSSGHPILDNAALAIVQKAQPFEAIPKEMLKNHDLIEIIRTWDFRGSQRTG